MPNDDSARLRWRAHELRALAARIGAAPALHLDRHAGIDTWRGSRAHEAVVHHDLVRRRVVDRGDDLHRLARDLERRADEIDASPVTVRW